MIYQSFPESGGEIFRARRDAFEAKIFFQNLLNSKQYVKKYYPPSENETVRQYQQRPKIQAPIISSIVNRIVNILNFNTVITASDSQSQGILDALLKSEDVGFNEFNRQSLENVLVTGANLSVLRIMGEYPKPENWDNTFINLDYGIPSYEYTVRDGVIVPVLSDDVKEKDITRVFIDDKIFGGIEHKLDFNPSSFIRRYR